MDGSHVPFGLLRKASDELIEHASTVILDRGMTYFQKRRVESLMVDEGIARAIVVGSEYYVVEIDLNHFLIGTSCTCPFNGLCKHVAAVVFTLYANYRDPAYLMQLAQHGLTHETSGQEFQSDDQANISRPLPATAKPRPTPVQEQSSIEDILHFVEDSLEYANLPKVTYWDINRYATAVESCMNDLLCQVEEWEMTKQAIYSVFVCLVAMRRITYDCRLAAESSPFFGGHEIHEAMNNMLMNQFFEALNQLSSAAIHEILDQVGYYVSEHLRVITIDNYRLRLGFARAFSEFWRHVIPSHSAFSREIAQIQAELDECRGQGRLKYAALNQMLQSLWILSGVDERVWENLKPGLDSHETADETHREIMTMIDLLFRIEAYSRVQEWLLWMMPYVKTTNIYHVHRFCEKWVELASVYPADDTCIEILRRYNWRAEHIYTDYLIGTNRDREWISYQLAQKRLPNELDKQQLKLIESRNLELVLPIYHQGVERLIESKNRKSYRAAVRLLKKLSNYYKKQKRLDKWQWFIEDFSKRYSRFRALQEEMKKGRLII